MPSEAIAARVRRPDAEHPAVRRAVRAERAVQLQRAAAIKGGEIKMPMARSKLAAISLKIKSTEHPASLTYLNIIVYHYVICARF